MLHSGNDFEIQDHQRVVGDERNKNRPVLRSELAAVNGWSSTERRDSLIHVSGKLGGRWTAGQRSRGAGESVRGRIIAGGWLEIGVLIGSGQTGRPANFERI